MKTLWWPPLLAAGLDTQQLLAGAASPASPQPASMQPAITLASRAAAPAPAADRGAGAHPGASPRTAPFLAPLDAPELPERPAAEPGGAERPGAGAEVSARVSLRELIASKPFIFVLVMLVCVLALPVIFMYIRTSQELHKELASWAWTWPGAITACAAGIYLGGSFGIDLLVAPIALPVALTHAVPLMEVGQAFSSIVMLSHRQKWISGSDDSLTMVDVLCLMASGVGYFLSHVALLAVVAAGAGGSAASGVEVLATVAFWCLIFRRQLPTRQGLGVAVIAVGLVTVSLSSRPTLASAFLEASPGTLAPLRSWSSQASLGVMLALASASSTVVAEWALKRNPEVDMNLQTFVQNSVAGVLTTLYTGPPSMTSQETAVVCFALILQGLSSSRVLKYGNAPTLAVVAALRMPLFVLVVARPQPLAIPGAVLAIAGAWAYLSAFMPVSVKV